MHPFIALLAANSSPFQSHPCSTPTITPPEFHIAPMQCYTNLHLRKLFDILSPSSIKWTEMEKVDDLLPNVAQSLRKRLSTNESNIILQLGSNDAKKLHDCVQIATKEYPNLQEVNLNCGCPSIDSGGATTYGASLMKQPSLTCQLVESMVSARDHPDCGISVKCRIGVFDGVEDLRPLDDRDYRYLTNYISGIRDAGAGHVVLHARPAVLSGLSPVKNRIVPALDYEFVKQLSLDFSGELKITLNGGIESVDQIQSLQSNGSEGISSFMAGRWCLRNPLDLAGVEEFLSGRQKKKMSLKGVIEQYIDYALGNKQQFAKAELCLPLFLVVEQLREVFDGEEDEFPMWRDMEDLHYVIQDGILQLSDGKAKFSNSINFKKLSGGFKFVGTKVANKWKRNRGELY